MRKIISNTTPIISLLKIGQLHLLKELYGKVIVPKAVWLEIEAGRGGNYYQDLTTIPFISIQEIQNSESVEYLTDLDRGEAEVIVLAREIGADIVIIDEDAGRYYARHFGLSMTGTLGILLRAKQNKLITEVRPWIELLIARGVWINKRVFDDVLLLAGEQE